MVRVRNSASILRNFAKINSPKSSIRRCIHGSVSLKNTRAPHATEHAHTPPKGMSEIERPQLPDNERADAEDIAEENREFIYNILKTSSTKREAKQYLKQFGKHKPATSPSFQILGKSGELDGLLGPPLSSVQRNQDYIRNLFRKNQPAYFLQSTTQQNYTPQLDADQIHLALVKIRATQDVDDATLRAVGRTLRQLRKLGLIACVVVDSPHVGNYNPRAKIEQAERIADAVENERGRARIVDGSVWLDPNEECGVSIALPNLLLAPLSRGVIPILTTIGCDSEQKMAEVSANGIILALSRLFGNSRREGEVATAEGETLQEEEHPFVLDRIIFLDPLGGIPSRQRNGGAHVFINLKQEYDAIQEELKTDFPVEKTHRENLTTLHKALSYLSEEASAIITSPAAAGTYLRRDKSGAPTREQARNPLIYNFLTNKPIISSSLPVRGSPTITTLVKLGMPLTILRCKSLSSPEVNLDKLVYLINDSFGRKLDTEAYLNRIGDNLAALIIAGDYEGAAIITWEIPPGGGEPVPYLDKFAVLRKSQGGGGGVADLVFKAMVMTEFKEGIVWRSRKENVVNRWYFERAKGHWILPNKKWTMFWTVEEEMLKKRFMDYVGVCASIVPTWKN